MHTKVDHAGRNPPDRPVSLADAHISEPSRTQFPRPMCLTEYRAMNDHYSNNTIAADLALVQLVIFFNCELVVASFGCTRFSCSYKIVHVTHDAAEPFREKSLLTQFYEGDPWIEGMWMNVFYLVNYSFSSLVQFIQSLISFWYAPILVVTSLNQLVKRKQTGNFERSITK